MIRLWCELDCIFKTFCEISVDFGPKMMKTDQNHLCTSPGQIEIIWHSMTQSVNLGRKFSCQFLMKISGNFRWFWSKNDVKPGARDKQKSQFLGKYSHTFNENLAKFSVILVIFRCQIHEETIFRFQVQIKAGALFSIFPPILNFEKMVKVIEFFAKKSLEIMALYFWGKYHCICHKNLLFFFWISVFLISRFSFFYSALFFCRWLSLFWEDNG